MDLDLIDPRATADRRARLAEAQGGTPALFFAGGHRARNYAANVYPFRASSHFLYFVGTPIPDAALLVEGDRATLFLPPHTTDDALWDGPRPDPQAIAEATGCAIRELGELDVELARVGVVSTLPAVDPNTRGLQERWLGRSMKEPTEVDRRLADAVIAIRLAHDDAALAEMRAAADATEAAHRAGMRATRAGMREFEVAGAMEAPVLARGMSMAYSPIVTTRGEVLHNHEHHYTLSDGDLLLCDVGAESRGGWASDVTRAWPVSGAFSSTQRAIYDIVLASEEAAIAKVKPGVRYRDVHLTAARRLTVGLVELGILSGDPDELVADGVHALFFPHGVGHLLGLDVHDMEDLGDRAGYAEGRERSPQFGLSYLRLDRDLAPRMAVTIEPGFYQVPAILESEELTRVANGRLHRDVLAKFADVRGIRIEDDVLVTDDGCEVLTRAIPKRADAVEEACA
ncbi:MAG: aminopeptidase P family protein [Sandaracinaceae bacterium]